MRLLDPVAQPLSQVDLIAIFGKRKGGKTTLCKNLQKAFPRVVVFDIMREYRADECDIIVQNLQDFARVLISLTNHKSKKFRIVYQFDIEKTADECEEFDTAMHLLYQFGDCMVVIEEIHMYMRREWCPEWLKKMILTGRHQKLGIMATSQKPAEVSKTYTSQCEHWFISRMFEKNDMKYFLDSIGAVAESLRTLRRYWFLHYIPGESAQIICNS